MRVALGEIGDRVHLLGGGVAGRAAGRLQRERDDGVAGHLVRRDVARPSGRTRRSARRACASAGGLVLEPLVGRVAEAARDLGERRRIERQRAVLHALPFGLDLAGERLGAEVAHQDLDARLVDVVAPAELVVDAQDRLEIGQQVALRQELADRLAEKGRAAEPAADQHLEADLAGVVAVQPQADVVDAHRGAVVRRRR